jgi:hypothetical protein
MNVQIPETPTSDEIRSELAAIKKRAAQLRALLRFAETRELTEAIHPDRLQRQRKVRRQHVT